jgi:hypothetical protein
MDKEEEDYVVVCGIVHVLGRSKLLCVSCAYYSDIVLMVCVFRGSTCFCMHMLRRRNLKHACIQGKHYILVCACAMMLCQMWQHLDCVD